MERKKISVEFSLNEENLKLLEEVNALFNKKGDRNRSIEDTFEFFMLLGSDHMIKEKLEATKEMLL